MLKKVVITSALFVSCLSVNAIAAQGPYVGANLGVTMPSDSDIRESGGPGTGELTYDPGFAIGAVGGYNFGAGRIEAEIGYKVADTDEVTIDGLGTASLDGDLSVLSFMGNGYIDFPASPTVKPFLMAGIGMANIEADLDGSDEEDDTVFAYQVGAGVGFSLNKDVTLDLSYRYMGTEDPEFDGVEAEYNSHNFLAGLRVQF